MRCIEVSQPGGLDKLNLVERPDPSPRAGEVLVRWRASSLNFHDYVIAAGKLPVADQRIPMSDGAGEIVAVGEGVSRWQPGDNVMSAFFPHWLAGDPNRTNASIITGEQIDGCAAELACVPATTLTAMPQGYSFAEAATLPCAALTAWRALVVEGGLKAGDSVLIEGTGGMSIFGLQIAKAAGARVYATTSSEEKAERLKALGADEVINYKTDTQWGKTVTRLSNGGVEHVLDVGGQATIDQSIEAAAINGHISLIGILGGYSAQIMLPTAFFKHLNIKGLAVGSVAMQEDMIKAIEISGLKPVIDRRFTLDGLADAFRYQETGQHFGKIVVEF